MLSCVSDFYKSYSPSCSRFWPLTLQLDLASCSRWYLAMCGTKLLARSRVKVMACTSQGWFLGIRFGHYLIIPSIISREGWARCKMRLGRFLCMFALKPVARHFVISFVLVISNFGILFGSNVKILDFWIMSLLLIWWCLLLPVVSCHKKNAKHGHFIYRLYWRGSLWWMLPVVHQMTWHDTTCATNHSSSPHIPSQPTTLLHLTPQATSWHQNRSHHHHGTAEKARSQQRNGLGIALAGRPAHVL